MNGEDILMALGALCIVVAIIWRQAKDTPSIRELAARDGVELDRCNCPLCRASR